ncbi:MAG: WD40/YVTN/BNR-like repeat-containing protein [Longimicrobiales bacterium]
MTGDVVLFIGTKRGLFLARSDFRRGSWSITPPLLDGREVYHAFLDPRDGRTAWAATDHAVWGAHVHRSDDGGRTWHVLEAAPHHQDERGVEAIWALAPGPTHQPDVAFAGIEPAGLFESDDRGGSWRAVEALNNHPTRTTWQPAGGGLALHSILVDPSDARRFYCAISAGGVYRSDDAGASWQPLNRGVRADFLPERYPLTGQCVHKLLLHPRRLSRLYQQNHCGTYRSDDRGDSWIEITHGLPSDFGYALALDPQDPDTVFVIPEESSHMRATVGGMLRVFRSSDAGATWQPLTKGLPQGHAYVSILRESMATDTLEPCGVYFGTSSGHLFGSRDSGDSWILIAGYLPRILSVTAAVVGWEAALA